MRDKKAEFIHWTPRVLTILFLCFLALFSLDVFEPGLNFGQIALGLFMHNIPVLFLAAILAIAWKHQFAGGIAFLTIGLLFTALTAITKSMDGFALDALIQWLVTAAPAFLVGVLFIMDRRHRAAGRGRTAA